VLAECPTAPSLAARPPRKTAPEFARRGQKNRVVGFARRRPQSRRVFASQAVETASGKSGCDYETALGRTNIAFADYNGSSAAVWHYTAFGKAYGVSGAAGDYRYLFTGREWLAPVGLQENRNRYYSPNTGRWLSRDSVYFQDGFNLYAYAHNAPIDLSDPFGTSCSDLLMNSGSDDDVVQMAPFEVIAARWNAFDEARRQLENNMLALALQSQMDMNDILDEAMRELTRNIDTSGFDKWTKCMLAQVKNNMKYQLVRFGIMSNISKAAGGGLTKGHAALVLDFGNNNIVTIGAWNTDTDADLRLQYRGPPEENGQGGDNPSNYAYQYFTYITQEAVGRLDDIIKNQVQWTKLHNCSYHAVRIFDAITGEELSAKDIFGISTPRALGDFIQNLNGGELSNFYQQMKDGDLAGHLPMDNFDPNLPECQGL